VRRARGAATGSSSVQRQQAAEAERYSGACVAAREEADVWVRFEFKIQTNIKSAPNLIWSKHYHPSLKKIKENYQETWFDVRNKLCHWSFFKFQMEYELKIRESKGVDFF
jgi:hypothetical protein